MPEIMAVVGCPAGKFANGRCTDGMQVQTYIFAKDVGWTAERAKAWLKSHDLKTGIEETGRSFRARQKDPGAFAKPSFKTIVVKRDSGGRTTINWSLLAKVITEVTKLLPFAGYRNHAHCVMSIKRKKGFSDREANAYCATIERRTGVLSNEIPDEYLLPEEVGALKMLSKLETDFVNLPEDRPFEQLVVT